MTKKMTKALEKIKQRVLDDPEISVITKRMLALSKRRSSTQQALLEEFYREVYKKKQPNRSRPCNELFQNYPIARRST